MTTETTIKTCSSEGEIFKITGKVCWLYVGDKRLNFFINDGALTDWHSGGRVGLLGLNMAGYTDRALAYQLIDRVISITGLCQFLSTINGAKKLNK